MPTGCNKIANYSIKSRSVFCFGRAVLLLLYFVLIFKIKESKCNESVAVSWRRFVTRN